MSDMRDYQRKLLNIILDDVKADRTTRNVAKAIFKAHPKAAIEYAEALPVRKHCERPIKKSYENEEA